MDNATIHQSKMVREAIEGVGAKLIYLSPYSPEFSPIENLWSKVKARTYKDLIEAIADAILQVSQQDIHNWFAHCCCCTS